MEKLFILISIHFLALISPGPDFIVVLRSSLSGKIKKTLACCIGISLGVMTHLLMAYLGLSLILSQSKFLYGFIVILGCLWLLKMSISGLSSKGSQLSSQPVINYKNHFVALRTGYLTNLLNPKALIYFLSVISPIIQPEKNDSLFFITGLILTLLTFSWFSFIALFLNVQSIRKVFEKNSIYVDRFFALIILIFACYIIYTETILLIEI